MMGMLGMSEESMWIVVLFAAGLLIAGFLLMYFGGEAGPFGFAFQAFRKIFYDFNYFFFGPRIAEV